MPEETPLAVVEAWQEAANNQDVKRLLELSAESIEIVGPRGSGYGHQLLQDWLKRAGLTLKTLRRFAQDNTVVVLQAGIWRSVETGEIIGESEVASRFLVEGGQVSQFARYNSLDQALKEAGLNYGNEMFKS